MPDPVVALEGVTRVYPGGGGVRGLTLRVEPGRCYGLLGRNGAGKTTALRLVMGMLRPAAGTVRIFGLDPFREPERAKVRVGYLAEDQEFPQDLTGEDLFGLYASFHPAWDRGLERDLRGRFDIPVRTALRHMSKGQRRQVGLVCAVAHRPEILVLDEPAGGLDPVVRRVFLEEVVGLLAAGGTAVLFSSHNLPEVERLADRAGILERGALLLEGDLPALREGSCRVLVRAPAPVDRARVPGCIRAAHADGAAILTLLRAPGEAAEVVRGALGAEPVQVQALSFEELFIDLVGGRP